MRRYCFDRPMLSSMRVPGDGVGLNGDAPSVCKIAAFSFIKVKTLDLVRSFCGFLSLSPPIYHVFTHLMAQFILLNNFLKLSKSLESFQVENFIQVMMPKGL